MLCVRIYCVLYIHAVAAAVAGALICYCVVRALIYYVLSVRAVLLRYCVVRACCICCVLCIHAATAAVAAALICYCVVLCAVCCITLLLRRACVLYLLCVVH